MKRNLHHFLLTGLCFGIAWGTALAGLTACSSKSASGIMDSLTGGVTSGDEAASGASPSGNSATASDEGGSAVSETGEDAADPATGTENEFQAILPPPSLDDFTLSLVSGFNDTHYAVLQGDGFDSAYDGKYLVVTHTPAQSARNDAVPLELLLDALVPPALAATLGEVCSATAVGVNVVCAVFENGAIADTVIPDFVDGDALTLAIFDPALETLGESVTDTPDATANLIYMGDAPASREAVTQVSSTLYLATATGNLFGLVYDETADWDVRLETTSETTLAQSTYELPSGYEVKEMEYDTDNAKFLFRLEASDNDSDAMIAALSYSSYTFATYSDTSTADCRAANDCRPVHLKASQGKVYFSGHYFNSSSSCAYGDAIDYCYAPYLYKYFSGDAFGPYDNYLMLRDTTSNFRRTLAFDVAVDSSNQSNALALYEEQGGTPRFFIYLYDGSSNEYQMNDPESGGSSYSDLGLPEGADYVDLKILRAHTTDSGELGRAVLVTEGGLYFLSYDAITTESRSPMNITPLSPALSLGTIVDVAYDSSASTAFLLSNSDTTGAEDDFITAVDLDAMAINTAVFPAAYDTDGDGQIPLSDMLGGYDGDIDPISVELFAPESSTNKYLIVGSRALDAVIVAPLQ